MVLREGDIDDRFPHQKKKKKKRGSWKNTSDVRTHLSKEGEQKRKVYKDDPKPLVLSHLRKRAAKEAAIHDMTFEKTVNNNNNNNTLSKLICQSNKRIQNRWKKKK